MSNIGAVTLRQLESADADAFSALRREVTADNPVPMGLTLDEELTRPLQGFREQLSYPDPNAAFGAFVGTQLVGSAAVAWPSKFPSSRHKVTLWGTFVAPQHRRRGLARMLVAKAIAHAQVSGARRINLTVFVPNEPAVRLYQSLGFINCGAEPEAVCIGGAYYDGQFMSLLLNAA
jgi:ribosomal protein S18 acetylase RimI-like enzyme